MHDNHHYLLRNRPNTGKTSIALDATSPWMVHRPIGWLVNSNRSRYYLSIYRHNCHRRVVQVRFPTSHILQHPQIHSIDCVTRYSIYVSHFDHRIDSSFRTRRNQVSSGPALALYQWWSNDSTNVRWTRRLHRCCAL